MIKAAIAFYNGKQIPLDELMVPADDRAHVFGDGVYEVLRVYGKKPFLLKEHMARLSGSLDAVGITGVKNIEEDIFKNIAINDIDEGMVYLQISRGTAPRNHSFHDLSLTPNILIYSKPFLTNPAEADAPHGISAITHEDLRWGRCDIKSLNLLPNCLAQTRALQAGAKEAILIRDNGSVTEGSSSNVFLVKDGVAITTIRNRFILPGTRRNFIIESFRRSGIEVIERDIDKAELWQADEIFITATIKEAVAVVELDKRPIGDGRVGRMARLAREMIATTVGN